MLSHYLSIYYLIRRRSKGEWTTVFSVHYKASLLAVKDEAKAELSLGEAGPAKKRDLCVLKRNSDARK